MIRESIFRGSCAGSSTGKSGAEEARGYSKLSGKGIRSGRASGLWRKKTLHSRKELKSSQSYCELIEFKRLLDNGMISPENDLKFEKPKEYSRSTYYFVFDDKDSINDAFTDRKLGREITFVGKLAPPYIIRLTNNYDK